MNARAEFQRLHDRYKGDPEYIAYGMVSDVVDAICACQHALGLSNRQVAKRAGRKRKHYKRFLGCHEQVPFVELVRYAKAVGLTLQIDVDAVTPETPRQL